MGGKVSTSQPMSETCGIGGEAARRVREHHPGVATDERDVWDWRDLPEID
jgi:hypothetical protein